MRRSQLAMGLFFSASFSDLCVAGSPKTVDCLQVSVVPNSADPKLALNPPQRRPGILPLHMILTNVCAVDVTAFELDVNVTSPIPKEFEFGADRLGSAARTGDKKFPRAGTEFPFDWIVAGEPEDDSRPLEFIVKVLGLIFRDGTAAGNTSWVTEVQEHRKRDVRDFAAELKLLAQIARLEDAKATLKGDPDASLKGSVRAFRLECKHSLSNDPTKWAESINDRAYWVHSLIEAINQHPDLTMEDK